MKSLVTHHPCPVNRKQNLCRGNPSQHSPPVHSAWRTWWSSRDLEAFVPYPDRYRGSGMTASAFWKERIWRHPWKDQQKGCYALRMMLDIATRWGGGGGPRESKEIASRQEITRERSRLIPLPRWLCSDHCGPPRAVTACQKAESIPVLSFVYYDSAPENALEGERPTTRAEARPTRHFLLQELDTPSKVWWTSTHRQIW